MIDIDDMKRRHQYRFFKDDIPDKEIIDKIVSETFELCPIKLGKWYFYIDVYGPEHYEEKRKFCLQTATNPDDIDEDPASQYFNKDISDLKPILDGYIEDKKRSPGLPAFNTQVLAPYVFAFRYKQSTKQNFEIIGASMFSYIMAVIANKYNLDASFCQCFFKCAYNYNDLYNTESDETIFFLCIGYGDKSYHDSKEPRPEMKDVIKWM